MTVWPKHRIPGDRTAPRSLCDGAQQAWRTTRAHFTAAYPYSPLTAIGVSEAKQTIRR